MNSIEHKHFEKFLSSSYFHKRHYHHSQLLEFYKIIVSRYNQLPLQKNIHTNKPDSFTISKNLFSEDDVIRKIYHDKKPESRNRFLKLKSELLSCFLDFLSIESFTRNTVYYKISILNELNKRNLDDIFWHYCREDRFNELNNEIEEPNQSFYVWKLVQALNIYKEKNMGSSSCQLLREGYVDYDVERYLLIKYFKQELADLQSRRKKGMNRKFLRAIYFHHQKSRRLFSLRPNYNN